MKYKEKSNLYKILQKRYYLPPLQFIQRTTDLLNIVQNSDKYFLPSPKDVMQHHDKNSSITLNCLHYNLSAIIQSKLNLLFPFTTIVNRNYYIVTLFSFFREEYNALFFPQENVQIQEDKKQKIYISLKINKYQNNLFQDQLISNEERLKTEELQRAQQKQNQDEIEQFKISQSSTIPVYMRKYFKQKAVTIKQIQTKQNNLYFQRQNLTFKKKELKEKYNDLLLLSNEQITMKELDQQLQTHKVVVNSYFTNEIQESATFQKYFEMKQIQTQIEFFSVSKINQIVDQKIEFEKQNTKNQLSKIPEFIVDNNWFAIAITLYEKLSTVQGVCNKLYYLLGLNSMILGIKQSSVLKTILNFENVNSLINLQNFAEYYNKTLKHIHIKSSFIQNLIDLSVGDLDQIYSSLRTKLQFQKFYFHQLIQSEDLLSIEQNILKFYDAGCWKRCINKIHCCWQRNLDDKLKSIKISEKDYLSVVYGYFTIFKIIKRFSFFLVQFYDQFAQILNLVQKNKNSNLFIKLKEILLIVAKKYLLTMPEKSKELIKILQIKQKFPIIVSIQLFQKLQQICFKTEEQHKAKKIKSVIKQLKNLMKQDAQFNKMRAKNKFLYSFDILSERTPRQKTLAYIWSLGVKYRQKYLQILKNLRFFYYRNYAIQKTPNQQMLLQLLCCTIMFMLDFRRFKFNFNFIMKSIVFVFEHFLQTVETLLNQICNFFQCLKIEIKQKIQQKIQIVENISDQKRLELANRGDIFNLFIQVFFNKNQVSERIYQLFLFIFDGDSDCLQIKNRGFSENTNDFVNVLPEFQFNFYLQIYQIKQLFFVFLFPIFQYLSTFLNSLFIQCELYLFFHKEILEEKLNNQFSKQIIFLLVNETNIQNIREK